MFDKYMTMHNHIHSSHRPYVQSYAKPYAVSYVKQRGFTLLEIIIALTIVVIALIGVYGGLVRNVKTTTDVEERLVANWVAANAVAETRIESRDGVLALKNDTVEMGGRRWRYEMTQADAANPNVAKVDVQVFLDGDNSPSTTITAYLQREL